MAGFRIEGNSSGNVAEVTSSNELKVSLSTTPSNVGSIRNFSENDAGLSTGTPILISPEVDEDFRLRIAQDTILDEEDITYTAQNFTKHAMYATTYVPSWTATGFNTNPTSSLTAAAAMMFRTYKTFSMEGTETLSFDLEGSFTFSSGSTLPANTIIEFGFGLNAVTTPYDCFDGVYFRTNNSGTVGVIRNNSSTDTGTTGLFKDQTGTATWFPVSGRKYQFIVYLSPRTVKFWINDPVLNIIFLAATLNTPVGYGSPVASAAMPIWLRQYQASAPAIASQFTLSRYNVRRGGPNIISTLGESNARINESIYSPGTLTTTQGQTITSGSITRPAAAVPSNTTSTLTSLGGIYVETGTLAIGTDAILMSYQVPALPVTTGTTYTPNKRLRIDGVSICSGVTTAFATGGFQKHFYIAYGSTNVSLAGVTADTATTKADRRVHLPIIQYYSATHAPGSSVNAPLTYIEFKNPIYVNPGEFIKLVTYHQGTVGTVGVITHSLQFYFSWE